MRRLFLLWVLCCPVLGTYGQDIQLRSFGDPKQHRTLEEVKTLQGIRKEKPYARAALSLWEGLQLFPGARKLPDGKLLVPFLKEGSTHDSIMAPVTEGYFTEIVMESIWKKIDRHELGKEVYTEGQNVSTWEYNSFTRKTEPGEWGVLVHINTIPGLEKVDTRYGVIVTSSFCYNRIIGMVTFPKVPPILETYEVKAPPPCPDSFWTIGAGRIRYRYSRINCNTTVKKIDTCPDSTWVVGDGTGRYAYHYERINCQTFLVKKESLSLAPQRDLRNTYTTKDFYEEPRRERENKGIGWLIAGLGVIVLLIAGFLVYQNNRPKPVAQQPQPNQPYGGSQTQPNEPTSPNYGGSQTQPQE